MIKIEFTEQELQSLAGIMDAGVRSLGLNCVIAAAVIKSKIETAIEVSKKPNPVLADDEVAR